MIFVTVGSQKFPFNRLLKKIDELIESGIINQRVYAQIGVSTYKPKNYGYVEYMTREEFNEKISQSEIIITHAGTGVIINALKKKKKVIAVPRLKKYGEHVDDHQVQLVRQFEELNFIETCYRIEDLKENIYMIKSKDYNEYKSNTRKIMESIEKYVG